MRLPAFVAQSRESQCLTLNTAGESSMRTNAKSLFSCLQQAGILLALLAQLSALAADTPVPDKGDTAWMLTSTTLVILMTIPGLALFYGGMVRGKNVLSVLMHVFMTFSLV